MARSGDGVHLKGKTWWLEMMHQGKRYYVRLGKNINKTVAKDLASVQRARILKGELGMGSRKDLKFEQAAELFLQYAETNLKPNTIDFYRQCILQLGKSFAGKRLSQIHPFHVEAYKAKRLKDGSSTRVNRELATLKALYNRCATLKKFEGANPVREVKLLRESRGRVRFLEEDEEERLLAGANEPLRTLILVGTNVGLRVRAEAFTLRWGNVDLERGLVTVEAAYAKNGKMRGVQLNSRVRRALAELRDRSLRTGPEDLVFMNRDGKPFRSIRTAFETARRKAGLGADVTPHVLRHTFASRLVMRGVDLRTVQELGGWAQLSMVQRYSHLSPTHKAAAVELLVSKTPMEVGIYESIPNRATIA